MKTLVTFNDIEFSVVWWREDHLCSFEIYDVVGWVDESETRPLWQKGGSLSSSETVDDLHNAELFAHGSVKWDGCSNWHFDEQDRVMLHACDRDRLVAFGEVLARCYDIANPEK